MFSPPPPPGFWDRPLEPKPVPRDQRSPDPPPPAGLRWGTPDPREDLFEPPTRRMLGLAALAGALIGAFHAFATFALVTPWIIVLAPLGALVGWLTGVSLGIVLCHRAAESRRPKGPITGPLVLAAPAYFGAGLAAVTVGTPWTVLPDGLAAMLPGAAVAMVVSMLVLWLAVVPVTLAFLPGSEPRKTPAEVAGCSTRFWASAFCVLWAGPSFLVVLLILAAIQAMVPGAYASVAQEAPWRSSSRLAGSWSGSEVRSRRAGGSAITSGPPSQRHPASPTLRLRA
ncbi:MAG: hypothetical protein U0838_05480 [Chloroflexota bacterium]